MPVGFFSPPPPTLWASAMAVWLLRVWCSRGVPDIDIKLNTKWFPFHISASWAIERGNLRHIQHCQKKKPLRQSVKSRPVRSCLTCKFHTSCLIRFSFYLQSTRDGIFGEGLFFLRLNNTWNNKHSSPSITHACKHTHSFFCFIVPADETIAASCRGKGCWCGGFSRGIWKQFYWWRLW